MPLIYLVRHARPAASWGEDPDPGLDGIGVDQARATAQRLFDSLERNPVYSSPMRRCRETAAPLASMWDRPVELYRAVAEIPSPPLELAERHRWLRSAMGGTWGELNAAAPRGSIDYLDWRRRLIESLESLPHDSVVFTHFIAINAAIGAATDRDDVVCFRPDHASLTTLEAQPGRLKVVELGREADTTVLAG